MRRIFADLHLRVNTKDRQATKQVSSRAAQMGYGLISIPFTSGVEEEEINKIRVICSDFGLDFVSRLDLYPRNENDLTHFLRKYRRKFEILSVSCDNKDIARQAGKDRRVDLLTFNSIDYRKRFFDRAEAQLATSSLAALEIDVKPLLLLEGPSRVRFLATLRREVSIAEEFNVPIVLSSGVGEGRLMRRPKDLASLAYLFGMEDSSALDSVSILPYSIIRRNRAKLNEHYVAPGIVQIKEGKT